MNRAATSRSVEILLVEDNRGDVRLVQEAMKEAPLRKNLHVVSNGLEALAFLRRKAPYQDAVRPDLILLDLNLPRMDGREVLREVKSDPALLRIPVVVLTSSEAPQDIAHAYDLHANCFLSKPADLDEFFRLVSALEDFWFGLVKLPPR